MTANELEKIIDEQLQAAEKRASMPRECLPQIRFHSDFATIVKGVRRCGKSTLTEQWRRATEDGTLSLNFDDLRMMSFATDDFKVLDRVIDAHHPTTLIFDEIHNVTGWELYVRQKLDQNYRVLVTGSNATMLSRELGTRLSGRHIDVELSPFSYSEFLRFTKQQPSQESLKDYLHRGGFPSYLRTGDSEVLKELVNDILYKDIAVRYHIRDVKPIRDLCMFLLSNPSARVNPSRLKEAMRVKSATTMLEYFNYFEYAYLVHRMNCYSPSTRAQLLASKKVYLADTALANALTLSATPNLGNLLENVVFNHLRTMTTELYYHDESDHECDFVFRDVKGVWSAMQVAWELTDENREREFKGLAYALKHFGLKKGTIVTADTSDYAVYEGLEIEIVPAYKYLLLGPGTRTPGK